MILPTAKDCKPGLWLKLGNGWVVGPVVETEFDGVYVKFGEGTWKVAVAGDLDLDLDSPRLVVGVLDESFKPVK